MSCFDKAVELQTQGFGEGDVRAATATAYTGGVLRTFVEMKAMEIQASMELKTKGN